MIIASSFTANDFISIGIWYLTASDIALSEFGTAENRELHFTCPNDKIIDLQRKKRALVAFAGTDGSNQPAHSHSMIRTYTYNCKGDRTPLGCVQKCKVIASAQSEQGLYWPLTELLDTT